MSTDRPRVSIRRYLSELALAPRRIRELEEAMQENRRLNRRIAELVDVVAELLVPATERDEAKLAELLERFRQDSLAI